MTAGASGPAAPPVLAWRAWWPAHLVRHAPLRLALGAILGAAALAIVLVLSPALPGAILLAALAFVLDEAWLPVAYRMDGRGVELRTALRRRHVEWGALTLARATADGVLLSSPVRRSLHLLAGKRREEILDYARTRLAAGERGPA